MVLELVDPPGVIRKGKQRVFEHRQIHSCTACKVLPKILNHLGAFRYPFKMSFLQLFLIYHTH